MEATVDMTVMSNLYNMSQYLLQWVKKYFEVLDFQYLLILNKFRHKESCAIIHLSSLKNNNIPNTEF